MERLDKFLVSQNIGSRKEAARLVRGGAVTVNGQTAKDPRPEAGPRRGPGYCGRAGGGLPEAPLHYAEQAAGVLSATEDKHAPHGAGPAAPRTCSGGGCSPRAAWIRDTTGLLLITDDGDFAHRMLAPKSHVYKRYQAVTERPVTQEDVAAFAAGIRRGELQFAPARLWSGGGGGDGPWPWWRSGRGNSTR